MAVINVDDVYVLNETGAQVDKVTGLFFKDEGTTSGEKALAKLNIGAGSTNPNLLDNPWFTVRQRGDGPFTGNTYGIDRWRGNNSRTVVTGNSGYVTLSMSSSGNGVFRQILSQTYEGTYTFSAKIQGNGSGALMVQDSAGTILDTVEFTVAGTQIFTQTFTTSGTPIGGVAIRIDSGNSFDALCAKLERGSVSTLANDAPPAYDRVLNDCQYRCVVYDLPTNTLLCRGIATSSTNIAGVIDLPRSMAEDKTPTISLTGSLTTPAGNTITAVAAATYARKNKLRVNFTGTGFSGGTVYDIFTGSSTPKIVISADL